MLKTIGVATALATALYTGPIQSSIEFESAFAGVSKTVEASVDELSEIKNGIREMATEIPASVVEISAVAEAAGQLGIHTPNILKFTRVMADLGVATNLTGDEAATTLAKFANITGMDQNNFDKLGSTIVALGNNLATTEADIAAMALRLAGAGSQIGLSEAQIFSFAGALSSVGIEAEAGGTAFSKVMKMMQLAVETGNGDLAEFAKVSGLTAKEFKESFQKDAANAMISFITGLGKSSERGLSAIKVLDDMEISEARMSDALLRASQASSVFTDAMALGNEAWIDNKALTNEANQRYATTESAITMLKNAINDIGISLGDIFLPKLAETAKSVSEVARRFSEYAKENGDTVITVIKVTAGILAAKMAFLSIKATVLSVIGVVKTVKAIMTAYQLTQAAMAAGTGVWAAVSAASVTPTAALGAAMATVTWPVLAVVAAIAAAIAIVVLLIKHWDKVKEVAVTVWEKTKEVFGKMGAFFIQVWEAIKAPFITAFEWFDSSVIQPIITVFRPIVQKIGEIFAKIKEIIIVLFVVVAPWFYDNVIKPLIAYFMPIIQTIGGIFQSVWSAITSTFASVVTFFSGIFTTAWEAIKNVFAPVGEFFKGLWNSIVAVFTIIGTAVGDAIGGAFKAVVNTVIGFAEGLINTFINGINGAIKLINAIPGVNIELLTPLNIPKLEKGSSYTPDTFIAGDVGGKGGELITGARGRKVFTAAQTDSIFANINKAKSIIAATASYVSSAGSMNQFQPAFAGVGGISAPSIISRQNSEGIIIKYAPVIHASAGSDTNEIERILDENNRKLLDEVEARQRKKEDNERRQSYE
ncbi:MAG: phage tail tape measure protein [Lachnospiraceae bacterium]|nr:phage tail tape measure protein [Lachnospiraceae bacterium]